MNNQRAAIRKPHPSNLILTGLQPGANQSSFLEPFQRFLLPVRIEKPLNRLPIPLDNFHRTEVR